MEKRSRLEIIAEILGLCGKPQAKTRLMYAAGLSWRQIGRYLDNMLSLGLIEVHNSPTKYAITQKGEELLDKWKAIAEIITEFNR